MEDILDELNLKYPLEKIDIEENYYKARYFHILIVPSLIVVIDNNGLGTDYDYLKILIGARSQQEIEDFLDFKEESIIPAPAINDVMTMMSQNRYKNSLNNLSG